MVVEKNRGKSEKERKEWNRTCDNQAEERREKGGFSSCEHGRKSSHTL
jgi:hypothetical protein